MRKTLLCVSATVLGTVLSSGCSGDSGGLPDLPGKAPTLVGSWAKSSPQDSNSCLIIDENGDLVLIRGLTNGQLANAPDEIVMDGQWRTLTAEGNSIEYASVGEATLEGSMARLRFAITVRSAGINAVTFTTTIEGTYDGTRIVGTVTATAISLIPGLPVPPPPDVSNAEFVRSDC